MKYDNTHSAPYPFIEVNIALKFVILCTSAGPKAQGEG